MVIVREKIDSGGRGEDRATADTGAGAGAGGGVEAQFSAILTDAAKRYSEASSEDIASFTNPPVRNIADLEQRIDSENGHFAKYREKRRTLFSSLAVALRPVETIAEIASGAASQTFEPAEGVFGAVAHLINAAKDVSSTYDAIEDLFEQLKDFTARLNVYVQHEISTALRNKVVTILATLFEVFVLATQEIKRGRVRAYFKRVFWHESPVQPALERLKSLTDGEDRQVTAEIFGNVSELNIKTDRVEDLMNQMNQTVQRLRAEARERSGAVHRDSLKDILEPSVFPDDFFTSFNRSRVEGTGDWVLQDGGLQAWLRGEMPVLWMCGAPGTGKSFLTTRLIAWASENLSHIAYFFFRDNNPETRSILQALRDVAYQLSEGDAYYAKQLIRRLRSSDEIKTIPSAYRNLLVQPFIDDQREKTLYIFLDGIDEANSEEVKELLTQMANDIEDPQRPTYCKIQVALIGRSYMSEAVTTALDPMSEGQTVTTLLVTPERNAKDVSSFISESLLHSRVLSRSPLEFKYQVIEALEKQVGGLFILAKFMMAELNQRRHPRSILQSLQSYPKEINGMLMKSLRELALTISTEEASDLNEMLSWVACAEEVLTLQQLEAVLALRFGDTPFQLEESLRGQYSCFFVLEREDGLTTDDLMKETERKRRLSNEDTARRRSGSTSRARLRRFESPRGSSGSLPRPDGLLAIHRNLSPPAQPKYLRGISPGPSSTLSSPRPVSSRLSSPTSSDGFAWDMEFGSKKSSTYVSFYHTSVKEFFSKENSTSTGPEVEGRPVGFDPTMARVHIVKTCLSIFTDKEWFDKVELGDARESIKQYAAWYWQEHLAALDPTTIPLVAKRELAQRVHRMLTDEKVMLDWTLMYGKINEELEVLSDSNMKAIRTWMSDPEVQANLSEEARAWAAKGVSESPGIFKPIGDLFAKAWCSSEFTLYIPTSFCFKIVQAIAFMQEGKSWSETNTQWSGISLEERITKAAAWAGIPEDAHWNRRIGSTYLVNGMHDKALAHYNQALKLDHNSVATSGRIAYCLMRDHQYEEGRQQALECEAIELASITSGEVHGAELTNCKWRLYKDHMVIARCSRELGRTDEALAYYQKAMKSAMAASLGSMEYFEPEIGYLEVLVDQNRDRGVVDFLRELSTETTRAAIERSRLVELLLTEHNHALVRDWIPRAAAKAGEASFLIEQLEIAIEVAQTMRDPIKMLYLRLALGTTQMYSRNQAAAISLFETISFQEYRPRGNVPTRQAYAQAFQRQAALYKMEVLYAGLDTDEARGWIEKLEQVQSKQSKHQNQDMPLNMVGSDVNVAAIYLSLFYRLQGHRADAEPWLRALVLDSLDILSDDDAQNDAYALDNLRCLLIAANDIDNARALSQSMRRVDTEGILNSGGTPPGSSPVRQYTGIEPKLPEIQSEEQICAQCLDYMAAPDEYSICEYCMEAFCAKCLAKIKAEGNKTEDHRTDLVCRSDHVWFAVPPLRKVLHRGQILLVDGRVAKFEEWKEMILSQWARGDGKKATA